MMLVVRRRTLVIIAVVLAGTAAITGAAIGFSRPANASVPKKNITVVIDAGHGGVDGGVSGIATHVKESDINLAIAKKLGKYFRDFGIDIVMTREDSGGLYGLSSKGRKGRDMEARRKIIEKANPAIVISIHQNFFPQTKQRGAQVFYSKDSGASKALAEDVYKTVSSQLLNSARPLLSGDYYILNCHNRPSILVECGFLSNTEDEQLLISNEYQNKIAYAIFCGAVMYLEVI